jgi:hypothetical protein
MKNDKQQVKYKWEGLHIVRQIEHRAAYIQEVAEYRI